MAVTALAGNGAADAALDAVICAQAVLRHTVNSAAPHAAETMNFIALLPD